MHGKTCVIEDIFSAPRERERPEGSGEWTPIEIGSLTGASTSASGSGAAPAPAPKKLHLLGVEGEYGGERVPLPQLLVRALHKEAAASGCVAVLGRSSSCEVKLARDDQISRRHAQIEGRDGALYLRDLGSTYGTLLNGVKLEGAAQLQPGDTVGLGASTFRLVLV